ncbi:MAG: cyclopropane fatty acyl phospholipid synthase [Dehalococcoidia bacterium]|nr:cyclopropane fatty acyl phospholipid synthase [Dehalococcoidia bacterium]
MKTDKLENTSEKILSLAGVKINGNNPWDIRVHNQKFYRRVLTEGSLGLGESYMDEWWDCEKLDEFFYRTLRSQIENNVKRSWILLLKVLLARVFNMQSKKRALQIGEKHYDLDNELFKNMLDKRMVYSCAYWKDCHTIDEAQENKLDLVCQKLGLQPEMRILDIGCGWGSFGKYAAEKYKVEVIGITISKEQVEFGKTLCKGLPVEIRLQDYRDVNDKFDHIVSLGMIEHVGYKNHRAYMKVAHHCLKDDGLFLLHTIGGNKSVTSTDPWINKYIFPNGMLPSIKQIGSAIEGLFVMEDWHNFSADYDKTLMAWYRNFGENWHRIKSNYDERFCRMWKYYLLSCAGSFRARRNQLWQIVLSKKGVLGGYRSIR